MNKHNFTSQKLKGDAGQRSYYRISFTDGTIPKTQVLMQRPEPFIAKQDDYILIGEMLADCRIPLPAIYSCVPESGRIYLEDCGDHMLEDKIKNGEKAIELYPKAIELMAGMQTGCSKSGFPSNPAFARRFDHEKYMFELNHTSKWYINAYLGNKLADAEQKRLNSFYERLIKPLDNQKEVFTHRDYHSRNIMVKGGRYIIIDFQDARLGPMQYDLVSLLFDSYIALPEGVRDRLLDHYKQLMRINSLRKAEQMSWMDCYYRMAIQRNLKALGTFGWQAVEKKNNFYTSFMRNTVDYIASNVYKIGDLQEDAKFLMGLITIK